MTNSRQCLHMQGACSQQIMVITQHNISILTLTEKTIRDFVERHLTLPRMPENIMSMRFREEQGTVILLRQFILTNPLTGPYPDNTWNTDC